MIHIEIHERRFDAERQHTGEGLILRMAGDIGEPVRPRNAAKKGHVRPPGAPEEHGHRGQYRNDHSVEDSHEQHASQGDSGCAKIDSARVPQMEESATTQGTPS
jgi:hypothetical protein